MDEVPAAPLDAETVSEVKRPLQVPADMGRKLRWMERALADTELSRLAANIACRLVTFHNDSSGQCNPKQDTLAKAVHADRTKVNAAVQELVERGYVTTARTRTSNLYRLEVDRTSPLPTPAKPKRALQGAARSSKAKQRATPDVPSAEREMSLQGDTRCSPSDTSRCAPEGTQKSPLEEPKGRAQQTESIPADRPTTVMADPEITPDKNAMPKTHRFGEFVVPDDEYQEWKRSFIHTNVDRTLSKIAGWAMKVPEYRRLKAVASHLAKEDEKTEKQRLLIVEYAKAGKDAGDLDQQMSEAYSGWTKQHLPDIRVMPESFTLQQPVSRKYRPNNEYDDAGDISLGKFLSEKFMLKPDKTREVFERFLEEATVNRIKSSDWIREADAYFKHHRKLSPPRNSVMSGDRRGSSSSRVVRTM